MSTVVTVISILYSRKNTTVIAIIKQRITSYFSHLIPYNAYIGVIIIWPYPRH